MRSLLTFLFVSLVFFAPHPSGAQQVLGPVAIVNDRAISGLDLSMRLRMAILSSNFSDTQEVRQKLSPQILRQIIDEELQLIEAERLGVEVTQAEINDAFENVAKRNNLDGAAYEKVMIKNGILPRALKRQIRTALAWRKLILRRVRPNLQVSQEEVETAINQYKAHEGQEQIWLYEIFIPYDRTLTQSASTQSSSAQFAQDLLKQIREKKAPFPAVAQQFSQSPTAAVGGDMGWIYTSDLPDEVRDTIEQAPKGAMFGPLEALGGYHIYFVRDKKRLQKVSGEEKISYVQITYILEDDQDTTVTAQATRDAQSIKSCDDANDLATKQGNGSGQTGLIPLSQVPGDIKQVIAELDIGQASPTTKVRDRLSFFVVCERNSSDGYDRGRIEQVILNQKIDAGAKRYLRDLRNSAYIQIRQ